MEFIETFCKHNKGEWAGAPLLLDGWQKDQVRQAFGWKRADGTRRFRTLYWEIPRKNGKSTLVAALGLYLLIADNEAGAEIYSSATAREQARIVWSTASSMVRSSPELRRFVKTYQGNLACSALGSKFEPLAADSKTLDGLNPHGNLVDELHAHRDRRVWDVLDTAMGARRQPMTIAITTAGTYDQESIGWQMHHEAVQVLEGVTEVDDLHAFISCADEGDDPFSPRTHQKANPSWGVSVKREYLAAQAEKAKRQPSFHNEFLRLHLNLWTRQITRWMDLDRWAASEPELVDLTTARAFADQREADLAGRLCFGGLDLSSKLDLSALVLAFPAQDGGGSVDLVCRFWLPEETIASYAARGQTYWAAWVREGWVTATPGEVIDYEWIRREVGELSHRFQLRELAFDPWGATDLSTRLMDDGIVMVETRQGFKTLSEPSKDLEARVIQRQVRHAGNPVLRFCVSNAVVTRDSAGNIKPDKQKAAHRIDGVVAAVMAISRMICAPAQVASPYESRGVLLL